MRFYYLLVVLSLLQLTLAVLILPNKGWAARIFMPLVFAFVFLMRKLSRLTCLSKRQVEIGKTLDGLMQVRKGKETGQANSERPEKTMMRLDV